MSESKSAIFIKNTASPGFEETDLLRCQLASAHLGGDPLAVVTIALDLVERLGDEGRVAEATAVLREVAPVALSCGAERQPWVPASLLLLHSLTCDVGPSNEAALTSQIANCWQVFQTNARLIDDKYLGFCLGAADKLLVTQDDFHVEELQKIEFTVLQWTERVPLRYHEIAFSVLSRLSLQLDVTTQLEDGVNEAVFSCAVNLINRMVLTRHKFSDDAVKHICSLCEADLGNDVKQLSKALSSIQGARLLARVSEETRGEFMCTVADCLLRSGEIVKCKKLVAQAVVDSNSSSLSANTRKRWAQLCVGILTKLAMGKPRHRGQVASAYPELMKWVECFAIDGDDQVDLLTSKCHLAIAAKNWPLASELYRCRSGMPAWKGYTPEHRFDALYETIQVLHQVSGDGENLRLRYEVFREGGTLARSLMRSGPTDDHDLWWWVSMWVMERLTFELDESGISELQEIYSEAESAITKCSPETVKYLANLMENVDAATRPHKGVVMQGTRLH